MVMASTLLLSLLIVGVPAALFAVVVAYGIRKL